MRQMLRVSSLSLLMAMIAGALSALVAVPALAQTSAKVTGEVLYRERIALPPSARVIVQLQDVSLADAPATVLAEQTIDPQGKGPPYAFELSYDAAKIDARFSYAVRAEIKDGDQLLFTTTQRYAVITQGNPTSGVQIVVQRIAAPQPAGLPAELIDRDWNLTSLQSASSDIQDITGSKITIRFSADARISGFGGCNGFGGAYTAGPNRGLAISNVISTLIACEEPINTLEQEYFKALQSVSSYTLTSPSRLQLSYGNGQGLLTYTLATPATQDQACFDATGNCVSGRFLSYWRQNGGLAVFGLPLTGELNENGRPVQYFERQRFELHAENAAPYDVLLGRLGDELLKREGVDWFTLPRETGARAGCRFFVESGHNVCDQPGGPSFLRYWNASGLDLDGRSNSSSSYAESLALFGLPLTEPISATIEKRTVLVQWFERARFEWHPDNPVAYRVLLGRLGAELLSAATPGNEVDANVPADVTLTDVDNGKSVAIKAGQTLAVRLDSNPSTGYSWRVSQADGALLKLQGEPQYIAPADAPPGAGGAQVFLFTALGAGQSTLSLVYTRPFEPDAAPAQTFTIQVTVQ